ncbi:MAG: oligosaccharide flippase family protein [Cyclobacteriaceae bacterium]|nr:oligosaccharide flippase family protein [Cyclobacteriaceae bacterium]
MGIVARQSIISSVFLYLGAALGYLNILYLFPAYLSETEIGITRTVQDMAALFVPIAQFGMTQSLIRFYPQLKDNDSVKSSFLTLVMLLGIAGYIVFFVLFSIFQPSIIDYFDDRAAAVISYIPFFLVITFLLLIFNLLTAYSNSLLKSVVPNLLRDVVFRLVVAMAVVLYFMGIIGFYGFFVFITSSYGLMALFLITYLMQQKVLRFGFDFSFLTAGILKKILAFALFSLLGTSGILVIGKIDSLMISGMLGLELNAVYTTVFYIAVIIEYPKRAIHHIIFPLVSRAFASHDITTVAKLYKQSSINQLIAGSILYIGIIINIDSIFAIMPKGDIFEAGKYVIIIIGAGKIIDMAAGINSEIVVLSKYYRFNMVLLALLAAVTIYLNLILIPPYGINGAALGSSLGLILYNLSKYIFLYVKFGIQPFSIHTLIVLFIGAISLFFSLMVPNLGNELFNIIVRSGLAVTLFGLGILILKPSPEVSELISRYLPLLRKKH